MSEKPMIVLDIDGVMADFSHGLESRIGTPANPYIYSLYEAYPDLDRDEINKHVSDPTLYAKLPVVLGAKKAVKWLHGQGFRLVCVTARPPVDGMREATEDWLHRYFRGCIDAVLLADRRDKPWVIANMDPGLAIDDSPEQVREAIKMKVRCLLFSRIYNINESDLPRVLSWAHLIKTLKGAV